MFFSFSKEFTDDTLSRACNRLLFEIIPVLASQVVYGTRSNGPFTKTMKASERKNKLKDLLDIPGIGSRLTELYRACWTPHVMIEYLEKAAIFTHTHESSLNITDTVQAMFQSAFTEFMIVMISRINKNRNIDILFDEHGCPEIIRKIFVSLLNSLSIPKVSQLKTLAISVPIPKPLDYQPMFPFFK